MTDAALLCALTKPDEGALRELHYRYAPLFYALTQQTEHPNPAEMARVVLEYIHVKSQGSLDRRDWHDALSIRGYRTGYREREAAALGLINEQQSRPRPKREPKVATIEADSPIPIHRPPEQFTPPSKPVK